MKNVRLGADAMAMISGSSAGTQPKYYDKGWWYKQNRNGCEGTAEHLISVVLSCSDIKDYVAYEPCAINGRAGCRSKNFLKPTEAFISFQRLYDMYEGGNLSERILPMKQVRDRVDFVRNFIKEYSSVDCSAYLSATLSLDMLSLNTDRHFHNLGIITDRASGKARPAPVFDNADALLSNYTKFPPDLPLSEALDSVYAQPFSSSHEVQAEAAGIRLHLDYDVLMNKLEREEPSRALDVLMLQLEKHRKLFA